MPHITHIQFNGHCGFDLDTILDLTATPASTDEKWRLRYWTDVFSSAERLIALITDMTAIGNAATSTASAKDSEEITAMLADLAAKPVAQHQCGECGGSVQFHLDGTTLIAHSTCSEPGGLAPYHVTIDVPSGVLVFANDLRAMTQVEDRYDVNKTIGQKQLTMAYAAQGLAHIFVGNTCPGVYQTPDGLAVMTPAYDEEATDDLLPGKDYGSICTDLWWYSAMDKDLFDARCAALDLTPEDFDVFEVPVPPGSYAFYPESRLKPLTLVRRCKATGG